MPLYCYKGRGNNTRIFHQGDGYFYHLSNNRPSRKYAYLRCVHSRTKKLQCFGSAKALLAQDVFVPMHIHSHEPNVLYPYACALKADIFARVKTGDQTPFNDIVQQEGQKYPMAVRAQVAFGTICSRMHVIRSNLRPPVPPSLEVLGASLLLPQYKYLTECLHVAESMFAGICGSMADKTLSLVFISPEMKNFMQTRNMVFADGTERKLFRKPKASQIYVISGAWRFHAIAMCRAIMLKRTQAAYEVLLHFLKTLMPNFKPKYVKCDFENAQMNGWKTCFPNADIEGCLWHYDVAVYSMAKKKLGLYHLVKEQEEVASIIRSAGALPLLPSDDIEQGLYELGLETAQKGWMAELRPFFKYWVKEWVPKIPMLSVKDSTHRTNNLSETTNRSFNKAVHTCNPSCFDVLRAFVTTNDRYTSDLYTLSLNLQPGRGRKISALRNDARIKQLTLDYESGDISRLQFLHQASRRMQNVFNKVFK